MIREGKVKIITQDGLKKCPDLPNVPLPINFAKAREDLQALVFMLAVRQEASKPYLAPPGVPKDRLRILRQAFDATMKDPAFLKEAAIEHLAVVQPLTGAEPSKLVAEITATPRPLVDRVMALLKH